MGTHSPFGVGLDLFSVFGGVVQAQLTDGVNERPMPMFGVVTLGHVGVVSDLCRYHK